MNHLENKKVLVVGLGKSGIAAAQALLKLGAVVSVYDKKREEHIDPQLIQFLRNKNVTCYFAMEPDETDNLDMVVISPGVPLDIEFVQKAKAAGAEVIGELEIAYRVGKGKYVAITGTNGKTTTTTLVGEIFKNAGRKTHVVGNVGVAVISKALCSSEEDWMVTETSSFQLETTKYFQPEVSALLNITPDHMDRHKTLENYAQAKAMIFKNQNENQYFVVNYDDEVSYGLISQCKAKVIPFSRKSVLDQGCFVLDGDIVIKDEEGTYIDICGADELKIPGAHNLENALAAAAVSYYAGISKDVIAKTLREFEGVEHRLEFSGEVDGVRFVNDSKGTNPDASIKAIEAINGGIILIAGGYDKGSQYDEFINAFNGKVKHLVLLGKTAPKIKETAERLGFTNITMAKDMDECVKVGYKHAQPGDTVLLSPACASWDMYTCFEQRGEHFKNCVRDLEK
ncbi:UDP-N-acetylmuramoyl-L-alanine--D-glutamate ligase [Sinanaerobacter chloroacetimidivorans]|uniref:UDP-N-acetylmuramoylalanine--D-glutamate ligase n=1 Tax=Sinanaerobacter chloroacetimidivorans TaxID=2818044 RepID=A0A8J7VYL0_9FIRM|nr:UDP-N-acetylmuramoyl-L-alanine--D-glutamate ligase [Sinanaerobacter chloroacetimidivorans]MBR0597066.1 UDP-N-acetylmuramoyl-L-alanine--D-glutamate ligase [Sinanaerobacter chloroacetimidivorans]